MLGQYIEHLSRLDEIFALKTRQDPAYVPFWTTTGFLQWSAKVDKLVDAGIKYARVADTGAHVFVTTSGHVVIAGQDLKLEDWVVLRSGAKLPVIIRSRYTASTLHGLAFVPGPSKVRIDEGLPLQEFVLC